MKDESKLIDVIFTHRNKSKKNCRNASFINQSDLKKLQTNHFVNKYLRKTITIVDKNI